MDVAVVIPNYNGARWLPGVLESVAAQTVAPAEVLVVDDGSTDGSAAIAEAAGARVLRLAENGGFARAANAGVAAVGGGGGRARQHGRRARRRTGSSARWRRWGRAQGAVATKMFDLDDPAILYSAGDVLRRDGVCEQRGRFERDTGAYDEPGEVFSACAGAALYRRAAVLGPGASTSGSACTWRTSSSGCGCGWRGGAAPGSRARWRGTRAPGRAAARAR